MRALNRRCGWAVSAGLVVAGLWAPGAKAALLAPGGTLFPVPVEPDPVGAVPVATITTPVVGAAFTGKLTTSVLTGDLSNPFGLDKLTFTYTLISDATSSNVMSRLTVRDFDGAPPFMTDVSVLGASPGVSPTYADRATADVVGFSFSPPPIGVGAIPPGGMAKTVVVQTDATKFDKTSAFVIDGSVATVDSFGPVHSGGVPEPASVALLAPVLGLLIKRRNRA